MSLVLAVCFWLVAALWGFAAAMGIKSMLTLRLLPPLGNTPGSRPRVSVVVAVRDEAARIEKTVRGLLAQEGIELQLIVVDDRSSDQTGAILRRIAADDPRLCVVRVDTLPDGWLGKCHACHLAAAQATGDWILFTDGDIWLRPDVIARAVQQTEVEQADHVALMPGVHSATFLGSVGLLLFGIGMSRRAAAVNRDKPRAYLGMGAFNLVKASVFRAVGGYERLRMEVADDLKLAMLLRRHGSRSRIFFAPRDADADWCPGDWGVIKGMEKNHFAVIGYRLWRVLLAVALLTAFWGAALVGPWTGMVSGLAAGLALLSVSVPAVIGARRLGWPVAAAFLVPFFIPILAVTLLNSAIVTLRQGGVRWRDTFYPLEALRAGLVR